MAIEADLHELCVRRIGLDHAVMGPELNRGIQWHANSEHSFFSLVQQRRCPQILRAGIAGSSTALFTQNGLKDHHIPPRYTLYFLVSS